MIILADILFALALGVLFALLFGALFNSRDGAPGFLMVFLLFFFFAWAGGAWIGPLGPVILGFSWLPGLIVTVLIFLLIAALASARPPKTTQEAKAELEAAQATTTVLGVFFWVLIVGLIVAIVLSYLV
jgi:hypothetical protein